MIPRKWGNYSHQSCNYQVCIANTGIHSNILVKTKNNVHNWNNYLSVDKVGIDTRKNDDDTYKYLSFGWGDKDFYMSVTSLSDFSFSTTFKAVFLPTPSVMYVKGYQSLPNNIEVKCIRTNKTNYLKLINFIKTSFQLDKSGNKIRIGNGHTSNAGFYAAKGNYSIFRTCNTWAAEGLRKADINTPLWDGLSAAIIFHLKSGCETEEGAGNRELSNKNVLID
ncbi:MAG: DUF2459 domain-containing protein [Cyanobacteria bacterium P01_A01_bin.84]